jgi:hypothetical protein
MSLLSFSPSHLQFREVIDSGEDSTQGARQLIQYVPTTSF